MQFFKLLKPFLPILERLVARWLAGRINDRRLTAAAVRESLPPVQLKAAEVPAILAPALVPEEVEEPSRGASGHYWLAAGVSLGVFLGVLYVIQKNQIANEILSLSQASEKPL
jgi:hypothetical protein